MYADLELLLTDWTRANVGEPAPLLVSRDPDLPSNLPMAVPFIHVLRNPEGVETYNVETVPVDVLCYTASIDTAWQFANRIRGLWRFTLVGQIIGTAPNRAHVRAVGTGVLPALIPFDQGNVFRVGATYNVTARATI